MKKGFTVYCDGSAVADITTEYPMTPRGFMGGYGVVTIEDAVLESGKALSDINPELYSSDIIHETTNNRMELEAMIHAVRSLRKSFGPEISVKIFSDSKYLCNGCNVWLQGWKENGWRTAARKPIENLDLWQRIDELLSEGYVEKVTHVSAHQVCGLPSHKIFVGDELMHTYYNNLSDKLARQITLEAQYKHTMS
jgi:ribonuclease HI